MTPLRNLPVAVLDFETTGLPFADPPPHVVSAAVVHTTLAADAEPRVAWSSLVRPPVPIPAEATRIHGLTDADVADAPTWAEVARDFEAAIGDRVVVAFNAPGDFTFQRLEQERAGRQPIAWPWLDLLVVRKASRRGRPGRLHEIADEKAIVLDAHGAIGDALTTALLLYPLMRDAWDADAFEHRAGVHAHYDREGDPDAPWEVDSVETLLRWQRAAALYQERDWSAYMLRQGASARKPDSGWHLIEGVEPPPWPAAVRTAPCSGCGGATVRKVAKDGSMFLADPATGEAHVCARRAS